MVYTDVYCEMKGGFMMPQRQNSMFSRKNVLTIPNLLSLVRLAMIPWIAWAYLGCDDPALTALLLALSGATDVVDGLIARRFHMISELGKALDPVADKLTQGVMLICLATRHKLLVIPVVLMAVKEVFTGLSGLAVIRRTGKVLGAQWHGKVITIMLYTMMIAFVLWQDMPLWASNAMIAACAIMMLVSFALYARRNLQAIREGKTT